MFKWHEAEAEKSTQHHASVMGGVQGKGKGTRNSREAALKESRHETADKVARYPAD